MNELYDFIADNQDICCCGDHEEFDNNCRACRYEAQEAYADAVSAYEAKYIYP